MITENEINETLRDLESKNGAVIKFRDNSPANITKDQLRILIEAISGLRDTISAYDLDRL